MLMLRKASGGVGRSFITTDLTYYLTHLRIVLQHFQFGLLIPEFAARHRGLCFLTAGWIKVVHIAAHRLKVPDGSLPFITCNESD